MSSKSSAFYCHAKGLTAGLPPHPVFWRSGAHPGYAARQVLSPVRSSAEPCTVEDIKTAQEVPVTDSNNALFCRTRNRNP
jgi:hypothetical protein